MLYKTHLQRQMTLVKNQGRRVSSVFFNNGSMGQRKSANIMLGKNSVPKITDSLKQQQILKF